MGEPFFEPSLPSGLVCALGFFLETNRSASISSMSCAETDRGQRIGPQQPQSRTLSWVYHCFVSHLHVLQYVVGICCRHIRVLGWKGNYFSGHCNFPIKTQHRLFAQIPQTLLHPSSPLLPADWRCYRRPMCCENKVQNSEFEIMTVGRRYWKKKKKSQSYRLRPPTRGALPLPGCSDVRGLKSLELNHWHSQS